MVVCLFAPTVQFFKSGEAPTVRALRACFAASTRDSMRVACCAWCVFLPQKAEGFSEVVTVRCVPQPHGHPQSTAMLRSHVVP